ncbi:gamma-glutamyltransferase family protein [Actinopolymorpha pittospori]|uniref:Gamma-glutamyltranspeptidase/glutathione hydrolase n=1 Tax=Actinopolymorpha pittospori TaxID=648752 RepID=A0A927MVY9_9ACTN|nr:gamma-glutamyltransferase family protein [Actinopolymorpha pittospori]MBE1607406.1 gamma-glutamyltranspeptidase/glutathione hydrolase [Actinopolymorpha pittospori]
MLTTRPELVGDFGMVASTHWLASSTGMSVLERGGNAADAAAAAAFVLQVVEPHLNGPGGDAPILLWDDNANAVSVICGQGVAPQAATIGRFDELGLDLVPGTGLLPAVVPGAFGAWTLLVERWGSWTLRDVLEPAVHLAEAGHPLLRRVSAALGTVEEMFRRDWPTSAATWLPDGKVPAPGVRFRNPVLAETYRRVVAEAEARTTERAGQLAAARDVWYRGFVAEAIGDFCANNEIMDTSGRPHRGLLTAQDLADWEPAVEEPTTFQYGDYTVAKTGPWGQGPVFLQQLALLAQTDLADTEHLSADWVHTITEASKLAFADREAWYGDPRFVDVPLADLLDPAYNVERARLIGAKASMDNVPGRPGGRTPVMPTRWSTPDGSRPAAGAGEPTIAPNGDTRGDTCHLDVVDQNGMMISATPSGGWFQSSPTIPGLGFCLSMRGQMFWLEEGLPNSLQPGKRPRTTLTPSFALRDGKPWMAFGTPGGDMQDQWTLHFFLNVMHGGQNLQEAIDAPDFHSLHMASSFYPRTAEPGRLLVEERLGAQAIAELQRRGHDVSVVDPWSLGRVSAVARDGGWLKAGSNPRGAQGYAAGR